MKELQSVGINEFIFDMKKEYAYTHKTHLALTEFDESVIQLAWRCRKTTHYNGADNALVFGELHALTATANIAVVYEMNQPTDKTDDVILSLVIYDGTNRIKVRSYSAPSDDAVINLMSCLHEQAKAIVAAVNDMSGFHA
jgi:hypothetical protein